MAGKKKYPEEAITAIESAASDSIMLEIKDLPAMAGMNKALTALGDLLGDNICADAAKKAGSILEVIIFEESSDPEKDFETVIQTITALQAIVCNNGDAEFPPELGLNGASKPKKKTAKKKTAKKKTTSRKPAPAEQESLVDDELFNAFIEQQLSVLPEIDDAALAFENDGNAEQIARLRRIIHTMKGEAGVCGIVEIEQLCHKIEDYLDENETSNISVDIVFEFKDWLSDALGIYRKGKKPDFPEELIAKFTPAEEEPPPAEDKEPQSPAKTEAAPPAEDAAEKSFEPVQIGDVELAGDFVSEAQEHFDIADENLLALENDPANEEAVAAVFRSFHTIKGVSGFIGLTPIGDLAHVAETLLDDVRKGKTAFEGSVVDVTFKALDMLKLQIQDLAGALTSSAPFLARPELPGLIHDLELVLAGKALEGESKPAKPAKVPTVKIQPQAEPEAAAVEEALKGAPVPTQNVAIKQTMKVESEKIDLLLDTIGELVIAESIVAQSQEIKGLGSIKVERNIAHLSKITRQLQDMGMAMRLVPIEPTFRKMARLVRDLAKKSGKDISFNMEGQETEIDKSMVEKIGDPLVHMIRNSVDHGIEASPEDRTAAGKDSTGHVTLKAFHKGGNIHIEITDDGRGLDKEAIVNKAIERGVISSQHDMSDQEIFSLIFAPGFSTAKQITEVSGRGVGMDVVKKNIQALRGNVLINSTLGKGTTFTITLPLTMAIIDGMQVKVGDETYIIPTLSIIESLRPSPEMISTVTGRGKMISFRDKLLPLFMASSLFDIQNAATDPCDATVVVVEDAGKQTAIVVDTLLGMQQTVIKSMGEAMGKVDGIAGACILADGKPGLILDINGIVKIATAGEQAEHSAVMFTPQAESNQ